MGGLGLGCEWLAGLVVWEVLGCVGFVYKIVEITTASSNNGCGRVLGLVCMGRNRAGSNLAVHFDFFFFFPCRIFLSVDRSHLRRNTQACKDRLGYQDRLLAWSFSLYRFFALLLRPSK